MTVIHSNWPFRVSAGLERHADIHITSADADNGKINATVVIPSRRTANEVVLRFHHPKAAPMKGVAVNGKEWKDFNPDEGDCLPHSSAPAACR
jgi:hypothetical protein